MRTPRTSALATASCNVKYSLVTQKKLHLSEETACGDEIKRVSILDSTHTLAKTALADTLGIGVERTASAATPRGELEHQSV